MLIIESPPFRKYLWTMTPDCHSFSFIRPLHVSALQYKFYPAIILKQLVLVVAWAVASHVSGLSVVTSQIQRCQEIKHFHSGQMASGHLIV